MFNVSSVRRIDSETVSVTITMEVKAWSKADKGTLYGIDVSNAIHREYGVQAYYPSVSDKDRARCGIKTITLYYRDAVWQERLPAEIIKIDFVARKRIA